MHLPFRFRRADRTQAGADMQPRHRHARFGYLELFIVVTTLISLNAATLLNGRAHAWAYGIIAPVVQAICGSPCLENSPTESRRREIEAAVREAEQKYASLQAKTVALVAATGALVAATAALHRTHALLTDRHSKLTQAHQSLKDDVRRSAKRVSDRLYQGSTRRVASMAGQAIPMVGTTLIWGLTLVDVRDACEAMKDLAALDAKLDDGNGADPATVCGIKVYSVDQVEEMVKSGWKTAYQTAANLINRDSRVKVPDVASQPSSTYARDSWCRLFGC
jgi:hypothetical protein